MGQRSVLGGVLRITSRDDWNSEQETVLKVLSGKAGGPVAAPIAGDVGAGASHEITEDRHSTSGNDSISVLLEGGNPVADELTSVAVDIFNHNREFTQGSPLLRSWLRIQERWVDALQTDPVFCADYPDNRYERLFNLAGITSKTGSGRTCEWQQTGIFGGLCGMTHLLNCPAMTIWRLPKMHIIRFLSSGRTKLLKPRHYIDFGD